MEHMRMNVNSIAATNLPFIKLILEVSSPLLSHHLSLAQECWWSLEPSLPFEYNELGELFGTF